MLRNQPVTAIRHVLTASLLGLSMLAHAASPKSAEEDPWTQVDLDSAPSVIVSTPVPKATATAAPSATPAPTPEKPASAPVVAKPPPSFSLSAKDRTIRVGLERWSKSAGWKLSWELPEESGGGVVRFDADFGSEFDEALSKLATAMRGETKVHAYLYADNKVLRIVEEIVKPVLPNAVPMTPTLQDGMHKDPQDKNLPYVTRVKGYWLGASGTESQAAPPQALPAVFNGSVSLLFSEKATIATVIGILSKVTGTPIALPGAVEFSASALFDKEKAADSKKHKKKDESKGKKTFTGTPKALLDRISVSTGLLWEFKDGSIVFTE
jgi:hypothetical protein